MCVTSVWLLKRPRRGENPVLLSRAVISEQMRIPWKIITIFNRKSYLPRVTPKLTQNAAKRLHQQNKGAPRFARRQPLVFAGLFAAFCVNFGVTLGRYLFRLKIVLEWLRYEDPVNLRISLQSGLAFSCSVAFAVVATVRWASAHSYWYCSLVHIFQLFRNDYSFTTRLGYQTNPSWHIIYASYVFLFREENA